MEYSPRTKLTPSSYTPQALMSLKFKQKPHTLRIEFQYTKVIKVSRRKGNSGLAPFFAINLPKPVIVLFNFQTITRRRLALYSLVVSVHLRSKNLDLDIVFWFLFSIYLAYNGQKVPAAFQSFPAVGIVCIDIKYRSEKLPSSCLGFFPQIVEHWNVDSGQENCTLSIQDYGMAVVG